MADLLEGDDHEIVITNDTGTAREARLQFTMRDANSTGNIPDVTLHFRGRQEIRHTVRLPTVVDTAPNYSFSYTLTVDGQSSNDSNDVFTVWLKQITIIATYQRTDEESPDFATGDRVPHFPFAVVHELDDDSDFDCTTTRHGALDYRVTYAGRIRIRAESPWAIITPNNQTSMGRVREFQVCRLTRWRAEIRSHDGGRKANKPFRQWVNQPPDPADPSGPNGSFVRIEVGPSDLDDALANQTIFVCVTFPARNSRRNDPLPAVWIEEPPSPIRTIRTIGHPQPGTAECKYEFDLTVRADGQSEAFYVQMGIAGGDRCTIEIGVTEAREDDVLHIQNWRRLGIELLIPQLSLRSSCTEILDDTGAALSQGLRDELASIFKKAFIEFDYPTPPAGSKILADTDFKKYMRGTGNAVDDDAAIRRPQSLFVPRNKIGIPQPDGSIESLPVNSSNTLCLSSWDQVRLLRKENLGPVAAPGTMTLAFVDFFVERSNVSVVGLPADEDEDEESDIPGDADLSQTRNFATYTLEGVTTSPSILLPFHVLDWDPVDPTNPAGNLCVHSVQWQAVTYTREGTNTAIEIDSNNDPGGDHRNWSAAIVFTTEQERNKWCQIVDSRTIRFKLPTDTATSPGNLIEIRHPEPDPAGLRQIQRYKIGITVRMEFLGVSLMPVHGISGRGFLCVALKGGVIRKRPLAEIMAHEIGHVCGQAYVNWTTTPPIPGVPFGLMFPDGPYYTGKGHVGEHCADGLVSAMKPVTDADRRRVAAGSFATPSDSDNRAFFAVIPHTTGHCLMWGDIGIDSLKERQFCTQCLKHLHAADLTDVRKLW